VRYYPIHFELAFSDTSDPEIVAAVVEALVEALTIANQHYLAGTPGIPALYDAGIVYAAETTREEFLDVERVRARGKADCEDLSAWRIAELRNAGWDAWPVVTWQEVRWTDGSLRVEYHVQVGTPHGIEDPSRVLGMR
jgi:hypothetical protein